MKADQNVNFKWDSLVGRIKRKSVIPVIGQGLYRIEMQTGDKKGCLLYDYLAGQILKECHFIPNPGENHKFAKACFEFLKNNSNDYLMMSDFLKEKLKGKQLVQDNSLRKLALIKNFNIFITTAYDGYLADTIKNIRNIPLDVKCYTLREKDLGLIDKNLFDAIENSNCTLVYHILGNFENCMAPAYTERDILETVLEFQKDMEWGPSKYLSQDLKNRSLLFMGCGYDDWLFRFFIRTVSNKSYKFSKENQIFNFVGDDFFNNKRDPYLELPRFLENNEAQVFYSSDGCDFVNMLYNKVEKIIPDCIISPSASTSLQKSQIIAFISFEGKDRLLARQLANNLQEDGIGIWLDEKEFKGGEGVDKKILTAIDQYPVFIPLISNNSKQIKTDDGNLKYHIQEWQRAYSNKESGDKKVTIIPVKIDDTEWLYDKFKNIFCYKILNGDKIGDYKKLKEQLKEIQKKIG